MNSYINTASRIELTRLISRLAAEIERHAALTATDAETLGLTPREIAVMGVWLTSRLARAEAQLAAVA
jgi:hypothetical protein